MSLSTAVATSPPPPPLGPVSASIEADLRTWVQRHGIVLWLDADGHYTDLVARLAEARDHGELPYDVVGFRGSQLEVMLRLEPLTGGVLKKPVVLHLPGFTEAAIRDTPLLELYLAGVRYRRALDTAITEAAAGRVRPEQIEAFKATSPLTLARADAWLHAHLSDDDGGLVSTLRHMSLAAIVDDLLAGGQLAKKAIDDEALPLLRAHLAAACGLPEDWRDDLLGTRVLETGQVAFAVAGWALAVEYVDDLARPPTHPAIVGAKDLPRAVIDGCRSLASHLRARHPEFYQSVADDTEALLHTEREAAQAADLGKIDTFRFEEQKVLVEALGQLAKGNWNTAAEWADLRLGGKSFWLRDQTRDAAWQLVRAAAALGQAIVAAGPKLGATDMTSAVNRYTRLGAPVDQAHRHLEQRRVALLYSLLPEFETLKARLDGMREEWRAWADAWSIEFNALCRTSGFLPEPALQQRSLFDDVVVPLCQEAGTTAYFVIDAFRFEMGEELYKALAATPATHPQLAARLAELPTVTEVGMNVLAPVARQGRLRPALVDGRILGFSTGEFRVDGPDTRKRAKRERVGSTTCPWLSLDEVIDASSLKKTIAQAKLVVVHSEEIDRAGEKGVGPAVFDTVMQKLRAAWRLLRDAGVRRFVFTADHGYLLLDERNKPALAHGRKIDPKRRHVFTSVAADEDGEIRVPVADLGYDGVDGQHLNFPASTAVFETGRRSMTFVHGGNSLQERVIPVLTVVHRAAAGASTLSYSVRATVGEPVAGMQSFAGKVEVSKQTTLDFAGAKEVELALRVVEPEDTTVELCQVRGAARIERGAIIATVEKDFEVFFRLFGASDVRALVKIVHPSATVELAPCELDRRFDLVRSAQAPAPAADPSAQIATTDWLSRIPDDGARRMFAHLAEHGVVTEEQAVAILGSARALRAFTLRLDTLAAVAPFKVQTLTVSGVKRYVREGGDA